MTTSIQQTSPGEKTAKERYEAIKLERGFLAIEETPKQRYERVVAERDVLYGRLEIGAAKVEAIKNPVVKAQGEEKFIAVLHEYEERCEELRDIGYQPEEAS